MIPAVFAALFWMAFAPPSPAQSGGARQPPVQDLYAFEMRARPLVHALEALIRETDISLVYESALVAGRSVDCRIRQADLDGLLRCILAGTGLGFYRLSGGTYVLTRSAEGAARTGSIAGRIVDADSGIPIPDAHVVVESRGVAVSADDVGRFIIPDLTEGPYELLVSHVAYDAQRDSVRVSGSATPLTLLMHRRILRAGPVIVVEGAPPLVEATFNRTYIDASEPASVPYGDLSALPALETGAGALLRDGYGELHVQGGAAGHVEYRIDGVPIFSPIPNGGLITPFSPLAIGHGIVHGAGFGADVGSRLSGIVDLGHAVPRTLGTHGLARIDPVAMNGRLTHARPIGAEGTMAFMLALRTAQFNRLQPSALQERFAEWSAPDVVLADVLGTGMGASDAVRGMSVDFGVLDAHGAASVDLGYGREVSFSGYFGRNEFGSRFFETDGFGVTADEYVWSNVAGRTRVDWPLSERIRLRTSVWTGRYRMDQPFPGSPVGDPTPVDGEKHVGSSPFNEVSRFGIRAEVERAGSARLVRSFGLEFERSATEFTVRTLPTLDRPDLTPEAIGAGNWRISGFTDRTWYLTRRGSLTSGIRITALPIRDMIYAEPRIAWEHELRASRTARLAYRLSGGLYREYMTQLDIAPYTESALLPAFRVWIPPARSVSPSRAWHVALDAVLGTADGIRYAIGAWHKYSPHVVGIDYARAAASEGPLGTSRLRSTGGRLSVALERPSGRIEVGTTLERSTIQYPDRFEGQWQAAPWNAPASVDLSAEYRPASGWTGSVRFAATGGRAWAWRPSYYAYLEPVASDRLPPGLDLSTPGNDRLPVHARLDLGVSRTGSIPGGRYSIGVHVLNVTDRRNVVDRMLTPTADPGASPRILDRLASPRLLLASLSISY